MPPHIPAGGEKRAVIDLNVRGSNQKSAAEKRLLSKFRQNAAMFLV